MRKDSYPFGVVISLVPDVEDEIAGHIAPEKSICAIASICLPSFGRWRIVVDWETLSKGVIGRDNSQSVKGTLLRFGSRRKRPQQRVQRHPLVNGVEVVFVSDRIRFPSKQNTVKRSHDFFGRVSVQCLTPRKRAIRKNIFNLGQFCYSVKQPRAPQRLPLRREAGGPGGVRIPTQPGVASGRARVSSTSSRCHESAVSCPARRRRSLATWLTAVSPLVSLACSLPAPT